MDYFRETLDALRVEQYGSHCSKKFTTIAVSSLSHSTSEKVAVYYNNCDYVEQKIYVIFVLASVMKLTISSENLVSSPGSLILLP